MSEVAPMELGMVKVRARLEGGGSGSMGLGEEGARGRVLQAR